MFISDALISESQPPRSAKQVLERRLDVMKAQDLFDQVAVRLGTLAYLIGFSNVFQDVLSLLNGLSICLSCSTFFDGLSMCATFI